MNNPPLHKSVNGRKLIGVSDRGKYLLSPGHKQMELLNILFLFYKHRNGNKR